jgi:hypothetical protein
VNWPKWIGGLGRFKEKLLAVSMRLEMGRTGASPVQWAPRPLNERAIQTHYSVNWRQREIVPRGAGRDRRGACPTHHATAFLEIMAEQLGEHHAGDLKRESADAKAERIIAEELRRLRWSSADLTLRLKSDPAKLQIAARLRAETTLPIHWIAKRLHLGIWKSANDRIHAWKKTQIETNTDAMVDPNGP